MEHNLRPLCPALTEGGVACTKEIDDTLNVPACCPKHKDQLLQHAGHQVFLYKEIIDEGKDNPMVLSEDIAAARQTVTACTKASLSKRREMFMSKIRAPLLAPAPLGTICFHHNAVVTKENKHPNANDNGDEDRYVNDKVVGNGDVEPEPFTTSLSAVTASFFDKRFAEAQVKHDAHLKAMDDEFAEAQKRHDARLMAMQGELASFVTLLDDKKAAVASEFTKYLEQTEEQKALADMDLALYVKQELELKIFERATKKRG